MMPILNSPMDFAEVNAPPESVEQNCLSNKTAFWGREVECIKVHFILLTINCINKAALRIFLYATLFSYKIEGFLKLCRNSIVNRKSGNLYPSCRILTEICNSAHHRSRRGCRFSTKGRDRAAEQNPPAALPLHVLCGERSCHSQGQRESLFPQRAQVMLYGD